MRKIEEIKGTRFIVEYDAETFQFVETPIPFSILDTVKENSAEVLTFPEPVELEPQPMRKTG